jgi:hypothetical protein
VTGVVLFAFVVPSSSSVVISASSVDTYSVVVECAVEVVAENYVYLSMRIVYVNTDGVMVHRNTGPAHYGGNASAVLIHFVSPTLFINSHLTFLCQSIELFKRPRD